MGNSFLRYVVSSEPKKSSKKIIICDPRNSGDIGQKKNFACGAVGRAMGFYPRYPTSGVFLFLFYNTNGLRPCHYHNTKTTQLYKLYNSSTEKKIT